MAAKKVRTGAESKSLILDTGAKLASKHGAKNVTRRMVAKSAKVAESLVTHYVGGAVDAQKKYAARARKLGLTLPTEAQADAIGKKLRAHKPGDARDTRKRTAKERVAVAKKSAAAGAKAPASNATKKSPATGSQRKPAPVRNTNAAINEASRPVGKPKPAQDKSLPGPAQNKSAARAPMAPPILPPLPDEGVVLPELPQ